MLMEIICVVVSFMLFAFSYPGFAAESVVNLIHFPILICMLILTVPALLRRGVLKDFLRAFKLFRKDFSCSFSELRYTLDVVEMMQKQVLCAGCIVAFQEVFSMLARVSNFAVAGPHMAVALLSFFYSAIMELLLLPLQLEAKRRIVNYMDKEDEKV